MEIKIDTQILQDNKLTISEYLFLKLTYEKNDNSEIFKVIDEVHIDSLQNRKFIKLLDGDVLLRSKALDIFEPKGLFDRFLTTFPVKTPSGRFLSPLRSDTIKGEKLEAKWKKLFKNSPHLEEKAIKVLEAELNWRKKEGNMEFIHNAEAWLNQGDYENFAYLLEEEQKEDYYDFM